MRFVQERQRQSLHVSHIDCQLNKTCEQVVDTVLKFTDYKDDVRVLRFVSFNNCSAHRTKADLQTIIYDHIVEDRRLNSVGKALGKEFRHVYEGGMSPLGRTRRERYIRANQVQRCQQLTEKFEAVTYDFYNPNVIAATQSTLLNTMNKKGPLANYIGELSKRGQVIIWVDEASQMAAKLIAVLAKTFPTAIHRYTGDPKQLQPFHKRGTPPILGLVPRRTLRGCRRMHPMLTRIASRHFYNGTLNSAIKAEER